MYIYIKPYSVARISSHYSYITFVVNLASCASTSALLYSEVKLRRRATIL